MRAVSGANGFLGSYVVCRLVSEGMQVRALRRSSSLLTEFEQIFTWYFRSHTEADRESFRRLITWVNADVTETAALEEAVEGCEEVYHCAAIVSFLQRDRERLMKVNAEGTANVVNICIRYGIPLCHVSSVAALGRSHSGAHIDESTAWVNSADNSNYAVSKHKAEMEVWRGVEEGLKAVIVNPSIILGVGDWSKGSCRLFGLVSHGMPFYTTGVNGYVGAADVADAMVELMKRKAYGQRFVLAAANVNMRDFLNQVAQCLGKKPPTIRVTPLLASLAAAADTVRGWISGRKPAVTRETARTSLREYYYSSVKAESALGRKLRPVGDVIDETCTALKHDKRQHT